MYKQKKPKKILFLTTSFFLIQYKEHYFLRQRVPIYILLMYTLVKGNRKGRTQLAGCMAHAHTYASTTT